MKDDMIGKRFGRLTTLSFIKKNRNGHSVYLFQCDCGNRACIVGSKVRAMKTKSCGCLRREMATSKCLDLTKHGLWRSRTYKSWVSMKSRCLSLNATGYEYYGGRGITICERWRDSFENFLADMGERPEGMTLDRIDNDGNYCPENCRWATVKEQNRNQRHTGLLEFRGQVKTLSEWADDAGITKAAFRGRLVRGWSIEEVLAKHTRPWSKQ